MKFSSLSPLLLASSALIRCRPSAARNVVMTPDGKVAIASGAPSSGLTILDLSHGDGGKIIDHDVFISEDRYFDDVALDVGASSLASPTDEEDTALTAPTFVIALAAYTQHVCILELLHDIDGYYFDPIECSKDTVSVFPYSGIDVSDGKIIVSGGGGGTFTFLYDTQSGRFTNAGKAVSANNTLGDGNSVLTDVSIVSADMAVYSSVWSDENDPTPRFSSVLASTSVDQPDILHTSNIDHDIRLVYALPPANFPLHSASFSDEATGQTFVYTAAGVMNVMRLLFDESPAVEILAGAPEGFEAVAVDVNADASIVAFAGIISGLDSVVLVYDISTDPMAPVLISSTEVSKGGWESTDDLPMRITSVATKGDFVVYILQDWVGDSKIGHLKIRTEQVPVHLLEEGTLEPVEESEKADTELIAKPRASPITASTTTSPTGNIPTSLPTVSETRQESTRAPTLSPAVGQQRTNEPTAELTADNANRKLLRGTA